MCAASALPLVLITGFPGFLARRLLPELEARLPGRRYLLLIEARMRDLAQRSLVDLERRGLGDLAARCELVEGDITQPRLGLAAATHARCVAEVRGVWHLAALYDLAVGPALAHRINVVGTANVLEVCEACAGLERLDYVSTCYVSGQRKGPILETELDRGQAFKNHYESTKFWAEFDVQQRWGRIPSAIYRPGIVVGDSRTGETEKYDGPYMVLALLKHLPGKLPVPAIGRGDALVNLIPVDFCVQAMAELSARPGSLGEVFQLADPQAQSSRAIMDLMLQALGKGRVRGSVPAALVDGVLKVGPLRRALGLPRQLLDYFNHPAIYDSSNTRAALADSGIVCPPLADYVDVLCRFFLEHPTPPQP